MATDEPRTLDVIVVPQPNANDMLLPPCYIAELSLDEATSLTQLQKLVNGLIDFFPFVFEEQFSVVINDEGKFYEHCRPNIWATRIAGDKLDLDDYICGTCALVSPRPGPSGETVGVQPDAVRALLRAGVPIRGAADWLAKRSRREPAGD